MLLPYDTKFWREKIWQIWQIATELPCPNFLLQKIQLLGSSYICGTQYVRMRGLKYPKLKTRVSILYPIRMENYKLVRKFHLRVFLPPTYMPANCNCSESR